MTQDTTNTIPEKNCIVCVINNNFVRALLMQNDRTLKDFPFRGPLYIHEKAPREQILQNNHKHGSRRKDFNKNKDTLKTKVLLWLQLIALVQN